MVQVHRVLPQWLAQPDVIQRDIKRNLVDVSQVPGLAPTMLKKLQDNGVTSFFPGNTSNTRRQPVVQPVTALSPLTPIIPGDNH